LSIAHNPARVRRETVKKKIGTADFTDCTDKGTFHREVPKKPGRRRINAKSQSRKGFQIS
jgi:hypothetical protein